MALTHTLTDTTRVWNNDAKEELWVHLRYAGSGEQDLYIGDTYDWQKLNAVDTTDDITTQPVVISDGSWRIQAPSNAPTLYIVKIPDGVYEVGAEIQTIRAGHSNGDIVNLTAGMYVIESESRVDGLALVPQTEALMPHDTHATYNIDEPIGFDRLQVEFKRHDYHGIGAEVSAGTLEFYGRAADVIIQQYNADIDLDVTYEVMDGSDTIYTGRVDLSTVSIKRGEYLSVTAKVGEIGVKTTFNNNIGVEIDVNKPKTIDGEDVEEPTWKNLEIPLKHLPFTNLARQTQDNEITVSGNYSMGSNDGVLISPTYKNIFIPLGGDNMTTTFGTQTDVEVTYSTEHPYDADGNTASVPEGVPQYISTEDFATTFGQNVKADVDIDIKFTLNFQWSGYQHLATHPNFFDLRFYIEAHSIVNDGTNITEDTISGEAVGAWTTATGRDVWDGSEHDFLVDHWQLHFHAKLRGELPANGSIRYYLVADYSHMSEETVYRPNLIVESGSYAKFTIFDTLQDTIPVKADMLMMYDALNVVARSISENDLSIRSSWYGISTTPIPHIGGGALKAITNGYHIRGLFSDDTTERNMAVSFKTLIESLSALDCVGWGFSKEGGQEYVRVERWDWFYKDNVVLNLTDVAEVTTDVMTDRIYTEFQIGYKKYATNDQYSSIDSPHGTRTFNSGIKAVSGTLTKLCDFIADNYAIEETRRAKTQKDGTVETTYDASIFVFELIMTNGVYSIGHTATSAKLVGNTSEFINAKLSPRHMAARWRDYLFAANNPTPFRFTTGEINYKASFGCSPQTLTKRDPRTNTQITINSLQSMATDSPQVENSDISYVHAKYKAERITFEYPLTRAQYNAIKANPYGLIGVNGKQGWIMDFKYKFANGMANFTLIAKYTE